MSDKHIQTSSQHVLRVLLIGETGAGKSTCANVLLAAQDAFQIGHSLTSCTEGINTQSGLLFGKGPEVISVSDTRGLGDTEGRDESFVQELGNFVREIDGVHAILFVHNAASTRLSKQTQETLLYMVQTLTADGGEAALWQRVAVVLTQCPNSIVMQKYKEQLPKEIQRHLKLEEDVTMFFAPTADSPEWSMSSMYTFFTSFFSFLPSKRQFSKEFQEWLSRLPKDALLVPSESTIEKRKRELAEYQELQEKAKKEALENAEKCTRELARLNQLTQQYGKYKSVSQDAGCFCATAEVTVFGRGSVQLQELSVGDQVLTQGGQYTEVVAWLHHDSEAQCVKAIELGSSDGVLTRMTPDHFLFVRQGNRRNLCPVPAKEVQLGDSVALGPQGALVTVTSKRDTLMSGLFAPLTSTGDLLVDRVLVSCYVDVGVPHCLCHLVMAPWRSPALAKWLGPKSTSTWLAAGSTVKHITDGIFGTRTQKAGLK